MNRIDVDRVSAKFRIDDKGVITRRTDSGGGQCAGGVAGWVNSCGYLNMSVDGVTLKAHRVAWALHHGEDPYPHQIDHIDHDRTNNTRDNLRLVVARENSENRSTGKNNTSGHHGVSWSRAANKWKAKIRQTYLGCFDNIDDAVEARRAAEVEYGFHPNHGNR